MGSTNRSYNILRLGSDSEDLSLSSMSNSSTGSSYFPQNEEFDRVTIHSNKVWVSNDPIDASIFEKLTSSMCENQIPKVIISPPEKPYPKEITVGVQSKDIEQGTVEHVVEDLDQVKTMRDKHVAHVAYVTNVSVASVCLCCTGQQARRCSLNVGKSQLCGEVVLFLYTQLRGQIVGSLNLSLPKIC